jgi:hypothetical protein
MTMPFRLQVHGREDGGWTVAAGPWHGRAHVIEVEAAQVERIWRLAAALRGLEDGPVPAPDPAWDQAERELGAALGALLERSGQVRTALREAIAVAQLRDEGLAILVDAPSEAISALPWELLVDVERGQYFEALGTAVVVRVGPAPSVGHEPSDVTAWTASAWCAGDDAASQAYVAGVGAQIGSKGIEFIERTEQPVTLLHLVAHGEVDANRLLVALSGERVPADAVVHGLRDRLRDALVVAIGVCNGGTSPSALTDVVLQAGAPTVIAAASSLPVEVASRFFSGFATAVVGGSSLGMAAAAGRRRVRTEAFPFADGRWHAMRLTTSDVRVACWVHGRARDVWWPSIWAPASREAVDVLRQARAVAVEMGQGFLGVEHLLVVLPARLPAFRMWAVQPEELRRVYEYVEASEVASREPRLSPRLVSLLATLQPGYSASDLFRLLQRETVPVLRRLKRELSSKLFNPRQSDDTREATLWGGGDASSIVWEMRAAEELEVVGGPEDGRRITLGPGEVLGRWAQELKCDVSLYDGGQVRDLSLPRRAARRTESGELELFGRGDRVEMAVPTRSGCVFLSASTAVMPVRPTTEGG